MLHLNLYALAFFQGNVAAMKQQADWAIGKPGAEDLDAFARIRYRSLVWEARESP